MIKQNLAEPIGEVRGFACRTSAFNTSTDTEVTFTTVVPGGCFYYKSAKADIQEWYRMECAEASASHLEECATGCGIQLMDFACGIGRGNDLSRNDQDFIWSVQLRFTVNR
jgi:hypothetical protein